MRSYFVVTFLLATGLSAPCFPAGADTDRFSDSTTNVVSVNASTKDLAQGYLRWLRKHPELRPGSGSKSAQSGEAGDPFKLLWPTLDIYSSPGILIFHGNDSETNVRIIQQLPKILPHADATQGSMRPTLSEAVAMFPELSSDVIKFPTHVKYTLFVINYKDRPACSAQNHAIQELKKRVRGSQVRVVEVQVKAEN
jgi:hypothetical protein